MKYKISDYSSLSPEVLDRVQWILNEDQKKDMNLKMIAILSCISAKDISYKERLMLEDIFKKAYVSSYVEVGSDV